MESPRRQLVFALSLGMSLVLALGLLVGDAKADSALQDEPDWALASDREESGIPLRVYVEKEKRPGNPAFRIETELGVAPSVAASTLMNELIGAREMPKGQTRTILERSAREVVVKTLIELPLMFSDREVAVRIQHSDDQESGVHRVDFAAANEVLPPAEEGVVRLDGTDGYWEFRPLGSEGSDGVPRTHAIYVTRASVGGSIPAALGDRLLKAQAVDSVTDLQARLAKKALPHVASPPSQ